jgi:hypothetical protein
MTDNPLGGNLADLLKKAQDLGQQLRTQQEQLAGQRIPISVGGGMVRMVFNGKGEALSLHLDAAIVNAQEIAMLQDLVLSAVNEGVRNAQQRQQDAMAKMAGGFKIPGLTG